MAADYYETLGVSRDATADEIKKAFYKKARKIHPDVSDDPDAEVKFKNLNEAYAVLSDEQKRAQYDRFGTVDGAGFYGAGNVDFSDIFSGFGGMSDIFDSFFGGGASSGRGRVSTAGRNMSVTLRLTLEEVSQGVSKEIAYDRLAPCEICDGTGLGSGGRLQTCSRCGGRGTVISTQRTILGAMQTQTTCPDCGGEGATIDKPCLGCDGEGRAPRKETVTIDVPKGIREGQQIRVAGYGEAGFRGDESGDLLVKITVFEHDVFQRENDNLHTRLNISMLQAALGVELELQGILPDEEVEVEIQAGTQNEDVVRVKGKGMPRFRSDARGDLYVHVWVDIPKKLNREQRHALEHAAKVFGEEVEEKPRGAFQKLKDALS